jgi:hypothetical protein
VATYWYQRIQNVDEVVQRATAPVSDARLRYATNAKYSGMFKDEPEVLQAFINADVPFSVAQRTMAEMSKEKAKQRKALMEQAGYTASSMDPSWTDAYSDAELTQPIYNPRPTAPMAQKGFWGQVTDLGKSALSGVMEGLNSAFSPISVPLAAGSAAPDTAQERWLQDNEAIQSIPVIGQTGVAFAEGVVDWAKGVNIIGIGERELTDSQKADFRRAGYDPESRKSRYAYYYQQFNGHRNPVVEDEITKLKNEYAPQKVDIVRELVTSGYFDDPVRNLPGLSPEAQEFAKNLGTQAPGSDDGQLVRKMQDTSGLSYGGKLADRFNMEIGSKSRMATSAVGDLATFWFIDPIVLAGGAAKTIKYSMQGVDASSIDKVVKALAASDDVFKPVGANAKRFDDVLRQVDTNYNLIKEGNLGEAAKNTEKFRRLHPDMMGIYDTLTAMRAGSITRVRAREGTEQLREATQAGKANRQAQPFIFDAAEIGKEKPVWSLTKSSKEIASAESTAAARAQLADQIGDFVWYEAITSGRPLYQGKMLLPGQVAVNRRVRQAIAPIRDAFGRQDRKFAKFLNTQKATIDDLDGDVIADALGRQDILTDASAQAWVKANYTGKVLSPTFGLAKAWGKGWRYFENSFSNKTLNFNSPESTELFRRWVVQFLPKRHAYSLVNEFANANPAGRYGLWQQTVVASLNASGMRNTPAAKRMYDQLTKGIVPADDAFGRVTGPLEQYTAPAMNMIRVGDTDSASAVHAYQLSEGVQLPNLRELRRLMNRTSVLGYAAGALNNQLFDMVTRVWKVAKVANPANMVRQAMELYSLTLGQGTAQVVGEAVQARYLIKAMKGQVKSDLNTVKKAMVKAQDLDHDTLARLDGALRTGDTATYHGIILDALDSQGIKGRTAEALARMGEAVDIRQLVPEGLSRSALAFTGPLDWMRRVRVMRAERLGLKAKFDSPWEKELDDQVLGQYLESSLNDLGAAADNYVLLSENRGDAIRDQVREGVSMGFGYLTPRVPNTYQWVDNPSNVQWANSIRQLQDDPLANLILRRIAMEATSKNSQIRNLQKMVTAANKRGAQIGTIRLVPDSGMVEARKTFGAEEISKGMTAQDFLVHQRYSRDNLKNPHTFARYLIGQDELGQTLRDNARRSNYTADGRFATSPADKFEAIDRHADVMVRDIVHRLGGKIHEDGRLYLPTELDELFQKVASGKKITTADTAKYGNEFKPEGMVAELFVPDIAGSKPVMRQRLTNMLGKAYHLTVSGPLASLASHPVFLAHRRAAYDTMKPVLEQLTERGMSTKQAAYLLESAANKRALNLTFNATDNPQEHSVFAELTDNFLMFNRAQEDFLKRFMRATKTNPALLARARVLVDAAHHAGVVTTQRIQSDDGVEENQLVFVYPGSAAATRLIGDAWSSLGGEADDLNMMPQYKGFSSQLRFINPSLTNPLQFSANPIIGMPLKAVRSMFPESSDTVNDWLTVLQGGERYFAEQDTLDEFLPTVLSRIVPIISKNEKDGQYASALRSALQYAEAAGIMPEPGVATPDDVMKAQDAIRSMVQNIMVQRAVFGVFAPAAPQMTEPGDMENNAHAMAEGITNIKGEWFKILEDQNRLYPDDGARALSESFVEWARRYPAGQSIANPSAFTVGSSQMVGTDAKAPSTTAATQWMLDNLDWVKSNRSIAFYLLPTAEGKWYEAAPYRLQFRTELREHKNLDEFAREVALSDEISQFFEMNKKKNQAKMVNPQYGEQLDQAFYKWADQWAKFHPSAQAELDRRNDPHVVHEEVAPALGRAATGNLPAELKYLQPGLQEMYNDYLTYREVYSAGTTFNRGSINSKYRQYGDAKWAGTPLSSLWDAMSKYEDD